MNKILLPAALLLLFLFKKKPASNTQLPAPPAPPNATDTPQNVQPIDNFRSNLLKLVLEMFSDNNYPLKQKQIELFTTEINAASMPNCEMFYNYLTRILNGEDLDNEFLNNIDRIAPTFKNIFETMAIAGVSNYGTASKDYAARDGNSDIWAMLDTISDFLPNGRVVYGVAQFIGNIFCGRKCRARRLERAGVSSEARMYI